MVLLLLHSPAKLFCRYPIRLILLIRNSLSTFLSVCSAFSASSASSFRGIFGYSTFQGGQWCRRIQIYGLWPGISLWSVVKFPTPQRKHASYWPFPPHIPDLSWLPLSNFLPLLSPWSYVSWRLLRRKWHIAGLLEGHWRALHMASPGPFCCSYLKWTRHAPTFGWFCPIISKPTSWLRARIVVETCYFVVFWTETCLLFCYVQRESCFYRLIARDVCLWTSSWRVLPPKGIAKLRLFSPPLLLPYSNYCLHSGIVRFWDSCQLFYWYWIFRHDCYGKQVEPSLPFH